MENVVTVNVNGVDYNVEMEEEPKPEKKVVLKQVASAEAEDSKILLSMRYVRSSLLVSIYIVSHLM